MIRGPIIADPGPGFRDLAILKTFLQLGPIRAVRERGRLHQLNQARSVRAANRRVGAGLSRGGRSPEGTGSAARPQVREKALR